MQMLYCFVNNIHVDYAELMWEGIYYSLHHPATSIPYPRFTKIIISHYMTIFPDISRHARDAYHNLQDDDIMKNIFNSRRNKNKVGMRIPAWMIINEMKLMKHYKMYAEVFGLDVPLTQSQPTESTQGTHRTPSAPRSPNPATETAESSVPKRSTVIRFRLPSRQSARLTPPVPVPTAEKANEMILQDTIQVSLAEHKSRKEQEAREKLAGKSEVGNCSGTKEEETTEDTEVEPEIGWKGRIRGDLDFTNSLSTSSPRNLCYSQYFGYRGTLELTDTHPNIISHDGTLPSLVKEKVTEQLKRKFLRKFDIKSPVFFARRVVMERKTEKAIVFMMMILRTDFRWVNKCYYKRSLILMQVYGVENWKNPHAKIFYIRRQKEPGRPKEEIYSNSKVVQVIKTYWELGHEHNFITEIVARRANDCIVSITEPDYKNLNKNDIEDMYLLIVNNKVPDYANTGLLWSLSVFNQEFSDMGKSARFSTWNRKLSTKD
ncbi:hypothetical protein Tco_0861576 [Tanacetum coccineum]|uniref:Uncharacterized protein n=1 Tax=Tanacetum coccineum TaxID=301880 RepID=A0ABQ5BMD3_9ASTR